MECFLCLHCTNEYLHIPKWWRGNTRYYNALPSLLPEASLFAISPLHRYRESAHVPVTKNVLSHSIMHCRIWVMFGCQCVMVFMMIQCRIYIFSLPFSLSLFTSFSLYLSLFVGLIFSLFWVSCQSLRPFSRFLSACLSVCLFFPPSMFPSQSHGEQIDIEGLRFHEWLTRKKITSPHFKKEKKKQPKEFCFWRLYIALRRLPDMFFGGKFCTLCKNYSSIFFFSPKYVISFRNWKEFNDLFFIIFYLYLFTLFLCFFNERRWFRPDITQYPKDVNIWRIIFEFQDGIGDSLFLCILCILMCVNRCGILDY